MGEPEGRDGKHRDAAFVDEERIFVGAVRGTAILQHAQAARDGVILNAMIEEDYAIGDIFLETMPREGALTSLPGDDRRNALILEPSEEAAQLRAQHAGIGK